MVRRVLVGALALGVITWAGLSFAQWGARSAGYTCMLGAGGAAYHPAHDRPPTGMASQEMARIYRTLCPGSQGCGHVTLVRNHTVPNAMAQANGRGATRISYNPAFMNTVLQRFGPGATTGILAHEFGHHLDLNTTPPWMSNSWSKELRADAWAGCYLARVKLPSSQLKASLRAIAAFPSATHPSWPHRHEAVERGYRGCGGQQALMRL